jgi:hypothetical protein
MTYTQTSLATLRSKAGSLLQKLYSEFGLVKTELDALAAAVDTITRSATIVIAASDSSAKSKAQADYVCTGTNDHITINAAIATLPTTGNVTIPGASEVLEANQGGKILLLEGSFQTAGAIDVSGRSNVTIEGVGPATVIYNTATDGSHAIQAINADVKNRIVIKNLTVVGNALSGDGIHLEAVDYQKVEDVYCLSNGGNGINICGTFQPQGAEDKVISNVYCLYNKLDGLHIESLGTQQAIHETLITNSHFEENYRYNIGLTNVIDIHINNCSIEDCHGTYELYSTQTRQLKISNCIIEGDISIGGTDSTGEFLISNSVWFNLTCNAVIQQIRLSNCVGKLTAVRATFLSIADSYISIVGTNEIGIQCTVIGGALRGTSNAAINAISNSACIIVTGVHLHELRCTFGVTGTLTGTRLLINSNHVRATSYTINGIHYLQMCDNLMMGEGGCTVSNLTGVVNISNNIMNNFTVTVDSTCTPAAKQFALNVGGAVIDNSA